MTVAARSFRKIVVICILILVPQAIYQTAVAAPSTSPSTVPAASAITSPDLALAVPTGSGEDQPIPIGTGAEVPYFLELRNLGAPASGGTAAITLPIGVDLGPHGVTYVKDSNDPGTVLTCAGTTGTVTCTLPVLPATGTTDDPPLLVIGLRGAAAAVPGTSATFSVAVTPDGAVDVDPTNNVVTGTAQFTGIAKIRYAATPSRAIVQVGTSVTLTLTITNDGPQAAADTYALEALEDDVFVITGFDGPTIGAVTPAGLVWSPGTIAPGHSATAHVTVRAARTGRTELDFVAMSSAANPACNGFACPVVHVSLVAFGARTTSPPTITKVAVTPAPTPTTQDVLAATGPRNVGAHIASGVALVTLGGLLLAAGRRSRRSRG